MDGLGMYKSEWNKSGRERQILYEVTYVESKKKLMSEYNKKETGSQI